MKKCVIIGSGLGGLSCGVILAKNGFEVTVLEQGQRPGGCLQCFRRGNATFNTGMHYIGSAGKGQVLQTILHYLGISSDINLSPLDPKGYDVISFKGRHYRFANGKQPFVDELTKAFPQNRKELERYYDLLKRVAASQTMHSLNTDTDMAVGMTYMTKSVNEVVESVISSPELQQVVAGILPLYAGVKDHTPFTTHALIHDSFEQSAYRIVGGSESMADALKHRLESMGGRVITNSKVVRIECDDKQAKAAITSNGERHEADLFVSTIHPANTVRLVESSIIRPIYRKRIESYKNTTSVFVVYLKFKKDSLRYMNHNLYAYRGDTVWGCENYDATSWPKFLLYMHFCHEANPQYAQTGKIMTYMNFDEVSQWAGTTVGHRGEDYENFKRKKAELLIDALEEEIPDIRSHIESYYTSSPLTLLDYTGTPEGTMYGIGKDIQAVGLNHFSCRTSVPNLLLAGQSVTLHGMFGVLAGSLLTCSEVLSKETIFSQLKQS